MSALGTLARMRRRELSNAIADVGAGRLAVGALVVAAAILGLGHAAAPSLMAPTASTATPTGLEPRAAAIAGATALEVAFWATAAAASISNFRVMELLLRRSDARALSNHPLPMSAILADRLVAGMFEVLVVGVAIALFFVPLVWNGGGAVALACAPLPFVGLAGATCLGFAIQGYSADAEFGRGQGDAYAGAGSLFLYGPGIALAVSMGVTLLTKMGLGEALRIGRFGRPTQLALLVGVGISVASLVAGWRYLERSWRRSVAGFREADFVGFNVEITYQTSAFGAPKLSERFAPAASRTLSRAMSLEFGRRHSLTRYAYPLIWAGFGWACWTLDPVAMPTWAATCAPLIALGLAMNPWFRALRLSPSPLHALAFSKRDEDGAAFSVALVEAMLFIVPCVLVAGVALGLKGRGVDAGLAAGGLALGALGLSGASALARAVSPAPFMVSAAGALATAVMVGVGASLGAWAILATGAILASGHLMLARQTHELRRIA